MNLSSVSDAKFEHRTKCQKANIHKAFCYANLVKSPTRLPEDPRFTKLSPEGLLMPARQGQKPPDLKYFQ